MCEPVPCLGAHGLGLLLVSPCLVQLHSNEPWHCAYGWSLLVHRALRPCAVRRHHGASQLLFGAIKPWHCPPGFISWLTAQGLGILVPTRRGGRLHQAPCRCRHGVHTTHVVEPMCACARVVLVCFRHAQGHAMVPPWCSQGFSWWLPSLSHLLLPPLLLKEQYGSFSLFLKETSIYLRRHNGIINNYKLTFQKSLSFHLHHLSQVCARDAHLVRTRCMSSSPAMCARCASGPPAVRVWLARGVRLACSRCVSGSPMASSLSPWSLNHQTSRLSLLLA